MTMQDLPGDAAAIVTDGSEGLHLEQSQQQLAAPRVTGGKGASGAWQRIVSMLPAHSLFIEAFAGSAALTRNKRPAERTILIERDPETAATLRAAMRDRGDVAVLEGNAFDFLSPSTIDPAAVLYLDPPYMMSTRKRAQRYYRFDWTDADHGPFLAWAKAMPCRVVISGYHSRLYELELSGWRTASFGVPTRRGRAIEHVWMNFPEPARLHEAGHVGESFTDRQRIKRKAARWARMLATMPAAERAAVLEAIGRIDVAGVAAAVAPVAMADPHGN